VKWDEIECTSERSDGSVVITSVIKHKVVTVHGVMTLRVPRALSWRSSLSPCALSRHVYIRDTSCKQTLVVAIQKVATTANKNNNTHFILLIHCIAHLPFDDCIYSSQHLYYITSLIV
jgi:hypothetical protein